MRIKNEADEGQNCYYYPTRILFKNQIKSIMHLNNQMRLRMRVNKNTGNLPKHYGLT